MTTRTILKGRLACGALALVLATLALAAGRGPVARHYLDLGREAQARWSMPEAATALRWACRLSGSAKPCLELVRCLQWQGDIQSAGQVLDDLAPRVRPGSLDDARAANLRGVDRYSTQDFASAIDHHQRARRIARGHSDLALVGRSAIGEARARYYMRPEYDEAQALLEEAWTLGGKLGDAELQADARRNLAVVRWFRGEWDGAREDFASVLEEYRRLGHRRGEAITLSNLSLIHYQQGDYASFLRHQTASVAIKKEIGDRAGLAESHTYLGALYRDMGHVGKAHDAFQRAFELSREGGYELGRHEAESRLLWIKVRLGRFDEAIPLAESLLASAPREPLMLYLHLQALGGIYLKMGETDRARDYFAQALNVQDSAAAPGWRGVTFLLKAQSYIKDGETGMAKHWLDRLAEHPMPQQGTMLPLGMALARARIAALEGRRSEALDYFLEAADIESRTRGVTGTELLIGQASYLYKQFLGLLFREPMSAHETRVAFDVLERLRYRSLRNRVVRLTPGSAATEPGANRSPALGGERRLETLRRSYSEYEDRLLASRLDRSHYRGVRERNPVAPSRIQAVLEPDTALVLYAFAQDRGTALVLTRERFESVALPVDQRALGFKVKLFRDTLADPDLADLFPTISTNLHGHLIAPLEASGALVGIQRLGIVPFGALHDLPFAGLLRAAPAQRFLVEDYVLFHPPSAAFIHRAREHGSAARSDEDGPAVVFGFNGQQQGTALRYAEDEARSVAALIGGRPWTGGAATESEWLVQASAARTLHVAAHAVSEPLMPLLSRLYLAPSTDHDGQLTVAEILAVPLAADLVTLGACRSAQSFSASHGLGEVDRMGLIEAFLYAGASTVVASLLPVDDRETARLMERFYGHLSKMDKASALAEAQRAALGGGGEASAPRIWAPFVVLGDDR